MLALRQIWTKYAALFPAIYFMLLGIFDIGMDLWHSTTSIQTWLNMILFIPIVFRNRILDTIFGVILSLLFTYLLLALIVWFLQYARGAHFKYPFETFVFGPLFVGFSLFCSITFVYKGLSSSNNSHQ